MRRTVRNQEGRAATAASALPQRIRRHLDYIAWLIDRCNTDSGVNPRSPSLDSAVRQLSRASDDRSA
ncbi:hypothetical protein BIV24_26415 [Streptomyces colonosanans]|uniref:Uncharacterized protein n=1 Tax=Streptomyces colonosanans TaxID=1428652 RepID=A0A1S2NYB8_9ACTN|nr:hypothetical protein BIV24_26415 [Streptomyces colonosanans]